MKQASLFEPSQPRAVAPPDPAFVRRHLQHLLQMAETAVRLPWSEAEAASWETLFAQLADALPGAEGRELHAAFSRELERLRAA